VAVAVVAAANFVSYFLNLIWALIGVLIPWCMINLLDFYVVKKQRYDIASIFSADGGRYGRVNTNALLTYFGGVLIQVPFVENAFFTGPYAHLIPGADISWGISLVFTSVCYLLLNKKAFCSVSGEIKHPGVQRG